MLSPSSDALLRLAAKEGKDETVKFLVEKGVGVSKAGDCRETALHGAADNGHTAIVEYLLKAGADIDKVDIDGSTALHHAVFEGYIKIAEFLLEKAVDINKADIYGVTAMHLAALNGQTEMIRLLIGKGSEIDKTDTNGKTALHRAVLYRRTETVKLLLEKGADINKAGELGRTALHLAAFNGLNKITAQLIEKGADIDKVDRSGKTAQQLAVLNGHQETAKLFIPKPFSKEQKVQRLIDAIQTLVAMRNEVECLQQEIKFKQKALDKAITKELQKKRLMVTAEKDVQRIEEKMRQPKNSKQLKKIDYLRKKVRCQLDQVHQEHEKAAVNRQEAYNELEDSKYKLLSAEQKVKQVHALVFQRVPIAAQKSNILRVVNQSSLEIDKMLIVAKEVVMYLKEDKVANMERFLFHSHLAFQGWMTVERFGKAKSNEQEALDRQVQAYTAYNKKLSELRCTPSHRDAENLLEALQANKEKATAEVYEMRTKRVAAEKVFSMAKNKKKRAHKQLESYKEKLYLAMKVEDKLCEVNRQALQEEKVAGRRLLADSEGITLFSKRLNKFEVAPGAVEIPFMPSERGLMEPALRSC